MAVETPRTAAADDPGDGGTQILLAAGPGRFVGDVPLDNGGLDLGPSPHDLLSAALAACTTETLRLYANRKGWPLAAVHVEVFFARRDDETPPDRFMRSIRLSGDLDAEQRRRLIEIAERCPVHRLLTGGATVTTVAD